jgi:hypothetical protein
MCRAGTALLALLLVYLCDSTNASDVDVLLEWRRYVFRKRIICVFVCSSWRSAILSPIQLGAAQFLLQNVTPLRSNACFSTNQVLENFGFLNFAGGFIFGFLACLLLTIHHNQLQRDGGIPTQLGFRQFDFLYLGVHSMR